MRRSFIFVAFLALIVVAGGAWLLLTEREVDTARRFSIGKVARGSIVSTVSATGTLGPVITVQVGSQVSGTIQRLYADFNSTVKKGELIAQIDPALFKAKLAEAEASLQSAQAAADKASVAVLDAERQLKRVQELYKKKLISESDVDVVKFAHQTAVVEHKVKQAAAAQAEAARDREQVNLTYTAIYAPIDGIVISRNVDVGQTVAASLQAPTLFTIAQDLTQMQIETEVDEAYIGAIKEGQPARFSVFAYQDRKFDGRVAQIRLDPKIEAGVVKYNCIIHVNNPDLALKPGMTATVAIETARDDDVFKVNNTALRFVPELPPERVKQLRGKLRPNEGVLWVPEGEALRPLTVALGIAGENETQIIGESITEGLPIALPLKRKDTKRKRRFGLSLF